MSKGFLKISILQVDSKYYNERDFSIQLKTDQASFISKIPKCQHPHILHKQYNLFPLADHLEVKLFENQETDTRIGYFKIPLAKLYELPRKNHLISTNCVWMEKEQGKIQQGAELSGTVKLSVIYLDNYTGSFLVHIKEATLTHQVEAIGNMDPFLQCKVGDVCSQTDIQDGVGANPKWNQTLTFILESIPSKIFFQVKDKDMVNDDLVGSKVVNPQQEGYLVESEEPIDRNLQLTFQGKIAGNVQLTTHLRLIKAGATLQ